MMAAEPGETHVRARGTRRAASSHQKLEVASLKPGQGRSQRHLDSGSTVGEGRWPVGGLGLGHIMAATGH